MKSLQARRQRHDEPLRHHLSRLEPGAGEERRPVAADDLRGVEPRRQAAGHAHRGQVSRRADQALRGKPAGGGEPPEGLQAQVPGRRRAGRAGRIISRGSSKLGDDIANAKLELRAAEESRDAYKRELAGETPTFLPEARCGDRRRGRRRSTRGSPRRRPSSTNCCGPSPTSIPMSSARRRVIEQLEEQRKQEVAGAGKGGCRASARSRRVRPIAIRCSSR